MAPIKRKAAPANAELISRKRPRSIDPEPSSARSRFAQTEDDSDPISESDTNSESGKDDGVSWPSEAHSEDEDQWGGIEGSAVSDDEEENGGVSLVENGVKSKSEGSSSREAHIKQKAAAKERKAAKPNADSIARSKKLWEKLRRKSHVPLAERKVLIDELFEIISGHVKDFVFKHDSVRVIQTALKYSNQDQKKLIAAELKGDYRRLSESKYGKFLVAKLLSYGDAEIRDMIIPEFYGGVRKLIKHPEASWILDDMYRGAASPTQKATLLREWYGSEFSVFQATEKKPSADLKAILAASPEKRKPIMNSLFELINQLIQKKTFAFTMLHDAMLQYFLNVPPGSEDFLAFITLLQSDEEHDLLKNLAFTASGAQIVCLALAHSNAKDRKLLLRTYKGIFNDMSHDAHAQQILLAAYDLIDDTVLVSRLVFPDLLSQSLPSDQQKGTLLAALNNTISRVPLVYLSAQNPKQILPTPTVNLMNTLHLIRGSATSTSKKDPQVRKNELLASISPPLLDFTARNARDLITTPFGAQAIAWLILSAPASVSTARDAAAAAIIDLVRESESGALTTVAGNDDNGSRPETLKSSLEQPHASRMLKNLVQGGFYSPKTKSVVPSDPPLNFKTALASVLGGKVLDWASGPQGFVVLSLVEGDAFEGKDKVLKILKGKEGKATLAKAKGEGKKGAGLILKAVGE